MPNYHQTRLAFIFLKVDFQASIGDDLARGLLKDVAFTLAFVLVLAGGLYLYAGVWPPMVSVDGSSMYPNLRAGDLIILRGLDRVNVTPGCAAASSGYSMLNGYGDVIVYAPMGDRSRIPVIHRAVCWVEAGQPMWPGGPKAPHAGFLTLGDNNFFYDQSTSISPGEPVKPEWILGVSRLRIPYLGLLRSFI
ncbi:S26 family signal peptidase [Methanocella sp.]|uniref:S26 family signal peptidase n=1 Tax=Methanocella sp. TaxID=2052833 RepID=UPI002D80A692|nr:S26 family signal peptidase [Methanocella sp.]